MTGRTIADTYTDKDGKHPWGAEYRFEPNGTLVWDSWLLDRDGKRALRMIGGQSPPSAAAPEVVIRSAVEHELEKDLQNSKSQWPRAR